MRIVEITFTGTKSSPKTVFANFPWKILSTQAIRHLVDLAYGDGYSNQNCNGFEFGCDAGLYHDYMVGERVNFTVKTVDVFDLTESAFQPIKFNMDSSKTWDDLDAVDLQLINNFRIGRAQESKFQAIREVRIVNDCSLAEARDYVIHLSHIAEDQYFRMYI